MGWLSHISRISATPPRREKPAYNSEAEHLDYPFAPLSTDNRDLPFIPASVVQESTSSDRLWLAINNIVYDCTDFLSSHPGGADTIRTFRASDCTWQFRRFHGKKVLEEFRALRIGRTEGVPNRYPEKPRFIGLRPLDADM